MECYIILLFGRRRKQWGTYWSQQLFTSTNLTYPKWEKYYIVFNRQYNKVSEFQMPWVYLGAARHCPWLYQGVLFD